MDHSLWTPRLPPNTVLYLRLQSHGVLLHFGGGVLCLSILESLPPFDFSGLPGAHAHPQKTRHECSWGSCRAGQGWGLSRVLDQVRYQERFVDGVVSGGLLWLMQIYFQLLNFFWFLWICQNVLSSVESVRLGWWLMKPFEYHVAQVGLQRLTCFVFWELRLQACIPIHRFCSLKFFKM